MGRQLPAIVQDTRQIARVADSPSTVARVVAAVAPDVIRLAERAATERLARGRRKPEPPAGANYTEAIHLSEVEIDIAMPFVRRITMRNLTAWQNSPVEVAPVEPAEQRSGGKLRKAGLLGASGMIALAAGMMMRRIGPFASGRQTIIDVPGRAKP
ncbi:MAG TPA: hypothetical protein VKZ96_13300 [Thermomicrobiales bacterium]|nr:hypothetical protein [Thermomicrobiales bacterium]